MYSHALVLYQFLLARKFGYNARGVDACMHIPMVNTYAHISTFTDQLGQRAIVQKSSLDTLPESIIIPFLPAGFRPETIEEALSGAERY